MASISEPNKFPKRSRLFGIGKEIGGAVYLHRQYESVLPEGVQKAKVPLPDGFEYTIVKYVISDGTVSFIASNDFDLADEPAVEDIYTIKVDGSASFRRKLADPWIYHHKWLFVGDDYKGFDVEAARRRSRQWLALDNIDFRRIGRQSYWEKHVVLRLVAEPAVHDEKELA